MIRSPWAREYARAPKTYIWGTEASLLARQVSALLPPGARVLDVGCGEGRDSVFFGHAHSTQTARYGRGFDPKVLASAVASITYPGVEIR